MNMHWRDRQINGFNMVPYNVVLEQEQVMLDFIEKTGIKQWQWLSEDTNFKKIFQTKYSISASAPGVIIFGNCLRDLSSAELIQFIRNQISGKSAAYVALNRYLIQCHNLPFVLDDKLETSLDQIMSYCDQRLTRLHSFDQVDGNHMIAAHPLDCYGYTDILRI
jgi:hypothetical protein